MWRKGQQENEMYPHTGASFQFLPCQVAQALLSQKVNSRDMSELSCARNLNLEIWNLKHLYGVLVRQAHFYSKNRYDQWISAPGCTSSSLPSIPLYCSWTKHHQPAAFQEQGLTEASWGWGGLCVNTCCIEGHVTLLSVRIVSLGAIHILQAIQKFHWGNPATANFLLKFHCRCSHWQCLGTLPKGNPGSVTDSITWLC